MKLLLQLKIIWNCATKNTTQHGQQQCIAGVRWEEPDGATQILKEIWTDAEPIVFARSFCHPAGSKGGKARPSQHGFLACSFIISKHYSHHDQTGTTLISEHLSDKGS